VSKTYFVLPLGRDEAPRVPIRPWKTWANLGVLIVLLIVTAIGLAVVAIVVPELPPREIAGSFAAAVTFLTIGNLVLIPTTRPDTVRVDLQAKGLRFDTPAIHIPLFCLAFSFGVLPGFVVLFIGVDNTSFSWLNRCIIFSLLSLVGLAFQLWSLRVPRGLTLTESGLRGLRGSKFVDLAWADLVGAKAMAGDSVGYWSVWRSGPSARAIARGKGRGGAVVVLELDNCKSIELNAAYTGSDAHVVAMIINFYLAHPEHRALLSTPVEALARVGCQ